MTWSDTMLAPDDLPHSVRVRQDTTVTHCFPDEWSEAEVDQHRFDRCPCSPRMVQCLHCSYHWHVHHSRIPA